MNMNHAYRPIHPGSACARFEPLLSGAGLGLLQPKEAHQLQEHVATCTYCRDRQAAYEQLDAAFRRYVAQQGDAPLRTEEILRRIRAEEGLEEEDEPPLARSPRVLPWEATPVPIRPPLRSPRRAFSSWVAAVAAVLVLGLITAGLVVSHHPVSRTGTSPAAQANPYPPYTGTLVWNDPLKDNSQGHQWDENDQGLGNGCRFRGGAYQVASAPFDSALCGEGSTAFRYFTLQVAVTFVQSSSPLDAAGIVFGTTTTNSSGTYYILSLSASGTYFLGLCNSSDKPFTGCAQTLFQGTCQQCHIGPSQSNILGLVVEQNTFTSYVNGQRLASAADGNYDPAFISFYGHANTSPAIIGYQDLKIWQL